MLGYIYQSYLDFLELLGKIFERKSPTHISITTTYECTQDIDALATKLGNTYRGFGVIGGILCFFIFFLAIWPFASNFDEENSHWVSVSELVLMGVTILLFSYVGISNFQHKWRSARKKAEFVKYESLAALIEKRDVDNLSIEIGKIYDDQISYNQKRYKKYELIEKASGDIMWAMFLVTVIAAGLHIFLHYSWLLFFTALPPVLGGTIHGINGFLGIGELANDHERMYKELENLNSQFQLVQSNHIALNGTRSQEIMNLANGTYGLLTEGVKDWEENIAVKQKLRPI